MRVAVVITAAAAARLLRNDPNDLLSQKDGILRNDSTPENRFPGVFRICTGFPCSAMQYVCKGNHVLATK